ncbi:unnamed protein product [Peronospora farinosa]|uniref:ZZ-type domain-containing protein n=1 Tax=Peronospora farinosa TaxID=134698 RepID=A0ABN8BUN2_9STRA|nr:unnamed protein product [Peronospora farinosa]
MFMKSDSDCHSYRYYYVAFAIFQCFLGAGVIFGWTSLVPMLEKERIYHEFCKTEETICTEQNDQLQYAFTMAVSSSMWSNLFLGLVFDKFGPRVTKSVSLVALITGALCMGNAHYRCSISYRQSICSACTTRTILLTFLCKYSFRVNAEGHDLVLYGMVLVGFSGPGIQLSAIHMANLFPEATALVACFIVGGLQLSFLIFTLFNLAYMHLQLSMATVFEMYAGALFLSLIGTLLTEPDIPFDIVPSEEHELLSPMRLPSVFKEEEVSLLLSTPELHQYRKSHSLPTDGIFFDGDLHNRSFRTQVLSKPFLLIVLYFSILSLWCNFFLGSITGLLRWKGLPETEVVDLLGKLAFILPGSIIFIPLVGYLLEKCGYTYSSLLCTIAALCFTVMLSSMSTVWIVAGFITYAFFRTIMFPLLFAYLGHRFGFQHYGALSGIAFGIGGIMGLLQTPIAAIGDFQIIGYIQDTTDSFCFWGENAPAVRPSVISTDHLNAQLLQEAQHVEQHLFFGPQQSVFEGERQRVIHGERKIQKNNKRFWLMSDPLSMERDSTTSIIGFPTEPLTRVGGLGSKMSAATRFIGQKVAQMKFSPSHVNEDSFCDGCGMDPIVGNMYSCSKCVNYHLCEGCYQLGMHGFEESKLLVDVREDFALRKVMEVSKNKVPEEVFTVLLKTVCRGQVDKFNFLAKWITAVVLDQPVHTLEVRGIEIPHLDLETRGTLVQLLTPVLADRTDLEVCMEWFCPDADNMDLPGVQRRMETIRIWVATDKDQKSPFATNESLKDEDTDSDMSPTSASGDVIGSPGPASPVSKSPCATPPPSPRRKSTGATSMTSEDSPQNSPPRLDTLTLTDKSAEYSYVDDEDYMSDSVKSDIEPRKVDSLSPFSGHRSEGIHM